MASDSERDLNVDAVDKPAMPPLAELPKAEEAVAAANGDAAATADKPLHELLSTALVTVYVGPEGTAFPVHEKLLCYHSPVLRRHFYAKDARNASYGLDDEEPAIFALLLGYLYAGHFPEPREERAVGPLLEAYLLAERLAMARAGAACVEAVRGFYQGAGAYPSLRRVQYVYERTGAEDPMRAMLVGSVARDLALGSRGVPRHWAAALARNGALAVDIIRAIQDWHLEGRSVPDVREALERGNGHANGSSNGAGAGRGNGGRERGTSASFSKVGGSDSGGLGSLDELNGEVDSSKLSSPALLSA